MCVCVYGQFQMRVTEVDIPNDSSSGQSEFVVAKSNNSQKCEQVEVFGKGRPDRFNLKTVFV